MALLASAALFEQPDGLYWHPVTNTGYREYPYFAERVDALRQRFAPNGQVSLVVGCGWGYLVNQAVAAGYDAYGIDASSYAIDKAKALFPAIASRFVLGDALTAAGMDAVSAAAGLHGNPPRFDLLITEDFLECLSDAEIATGLPLWRARCRTNLAHIVTPNDGSNLDPRINWKTIDQWKAIVSPPDVLIGPNGEQI